MRKKQIRKKMDVYEKAEMRKVKFLHTEKDIGVVNTSAACAVCTCATCACACATCACAGTCACGTCTCST